MRPRDHFVPLSKSLLDQDADRLLNIDGFVVWEQDGQWFSRAEGGYLIEPILIEREQSRDECVQLTEILLGFRLQQIQSAIETPLWATSAIERLIDPGPTVHTANGVQLLLDRVSESEHLSRLFPHLAESVIVPDPAEYDSRAFLSMSDLHGADTPSQVGPRGWEYLLRFRFPTKELTVWHELAHAAATRAASEHHGPEFARCYVEVLREAVSPKVASVLEQVIEASGDRLARDSELLSAQEAARQQWVELWLLEVLDSQSWSEELGVDWGQAVWSLWSFSSRLAGGLDLEQAASLLAGALGRPVQGSDLRAQKDWARPVTSVEDKALVILWLAIAGYGSVERTASSLGLDIEEVPMPQPETVSALSEQLRRHSPD